LGQTLSPAFALHGIRAALAVAAVLALFLLATGSPAPARGDTTFTVDSQADVVDASPGDGACATAGGACTLRAAIMEANGLAGADTINIPAGTYTLTIPSEQNFSSDADGDLDIGDNLTIVGTGRSSTVVDADFLDRAFQVFGGIAAEVSGLTVRHGLTQFSGGGIQSNGNLKLQNAELFANYAVLDGGGVHSAGTLTLIDTDVRVNEAERDGGGIFSAIGSSLSVTDSVIGTNYARGGGGIFNGAAQATLANSTVTDNHASDGGGGIRNDGAIDIDASTISQNAAGNNAGGIENVGTLTAVNSTFSGNSAQNHGGGIDNPGTLTVTNVTIAENSATFAGAIENSGAANLHNTIINRGPAGANCVGTFTSLGHNISSDDSCAASLNGAGDISAVNPLLGGLSGGNGGPTMTHALLEGSPAIDAGDDNGCPPTDQRGVARPQGAACDIGAFESGGSPPVQLRRGDLDCDGEISTRDNQALLRHVLRQNPLAQTEPCPDLSDTFDDGDPGRLWGDLDCDDGISTRDNQALLRYILQLPALSQVEPCIDLGELLD
jgi:CSLREA domain-containing protein